MNRLFHVLHRWKCTTLPQKLALDALRHLGDDAPRRAGLFLWHIEPYLRGVAAPEFQFRDYSNHVFYPVENWGGAARLAGKWYWRSVESLHSRDWNEAAYSVGVLTRYLTFAFMPLRTGHDEAALAMRAPLEWWAARCYSASIAPGEEAQPVIIPNEEEWLEQLVQDAAKASNCHFNSCTERFKFDAAIKRPSAFDELLRRTLNERNQRAAAIVGAILAKAITESGCEIRRYPLGPAGLSAMSSLPLFWMTRARSHSAERTSIQAMHREWKATGIIDKTLPDDARAVRDAYDLEVLRNAPRKIEAHQHELHPPVALNPNAESHLCDRKLETSRTHLAAHPAERDLLSHVVRDSDRASRNASQSRPAKTSIPSPPPPVSPSLPHKCGRFASDSPLTAVSSIDAKLVARIGAIGVATIGDLLTANAEDLAACLHPDSSPADVAGWQDAARLCCEIGGLSPAEAQLLAACGVTGCEDLAALSPVELWELVIPVAESPDGRRVLRGQVAPGIETVTTWINAAKKAA